MHVFAAVELNGCSVDVAGTFGKQERNGGSDFFGLADSAEWDAGGHGGFALLSKPATHDLGVNGSGRQHAHGDPVWPEFPRPTAAHPDGTGKVIT